MKMLMLIKQKLKTWPQLLILSLLISFAPTAPVFASGDATYSISPSSGSYTVGSTFSATVYETSSTADNTEGIQVNLTYNASLLQWQSNTLGVFNAICAQNTGGGGSVNLGCAATSSVGGGTQPVVTISFKVLASGTASVDMVTGPGGTPTDIQNSTGSVWSGNLPAANFSLANATTSSGSSKPLSGTKASMAPTTSTSTSTAPKTTAPVTTTKTSTTTAKPPALAAVTIIVTDRAGQPIKGAKVVLDNGNAMYTDNQGKASFSTETPGTHTVTVTAPGKQPYQTRVTLTAGQSIPLELQLTSASSNTRLFAGIGIAGLLLLIAVGWWYFKPKLPWAHGLVAFTPSGSTVVQKPTSITAPVARSVVQQPGVVPQHPEERQNRSFYLRRRDSFDGIRGRH